MKFQFKAAKTLKVFPRPLSRIISHISCLTSPYVNVVKVCPVKNKS